MHISFRNTSIRDGDREILIIIIDSFLVFTESTFSHLLNRSNYFRGIFVYDTGDWFYAALKSSRATL